MGPGTMSVQSMYKYIMGPCDKKVDMVYTLVWAHTIRAYSIYKMIIGLIRLKCIHHILINYGPMQCKRLLV